MVTIREAYAHEFISSIFESTDFFNDRQIFCLDVLMILILIIVVTIDFCGIGFCDFFVFFFWRDDPQPAPGVTNLLSATLWAGQTLLQTR